MLIIFLIFESFIGTDALKDQIYIFLQCNRLGQANHRKKNKCHLHLTFPILFVMTGK